MTRKIVTVILLWAISLNLIACDRKENRTDEKQVDTTFAQEASPVEEAKMQLVGCFEEQGLGPDALGIAIYQIEIHVDSKGGELLAAHRSKLGDLLAAFWNSYERVYVDSDHYYTVPPSDAVEYYNEEINRQIEHIKSTDYTVFDAIAETILEYEGKASDVLECYYNKEITPEDAIEQLDALEDELQSYMFEHDAFICAIWDLQHCLSVCQQSIGNIELYLKYGYDQDEDRSYLIDQAQEELASCKKKFDENYRVEYMFETCWDWDRCIVCNPS